MPRPLAIMLLASDVARHTILRMRNLGKLFVGDASVDLRLVLHVIDTILLMVQPGGLLLIQLPAGNTLVDPPLPIRSPIIGVSIPSA